MYCIKAKCLCVAKETTGCRDSLQSGRKAFLSHLPNRALVSRVYKIKHTYAHTNYPGQLAKQAFTSQRKPKQPVTLQKEKCLTSSAARQMKIKSVLPFYLTAIRMAVKNAKAELGHVSVVPAAQGWSLEFRSPTPTYKLGTAACICNPSAGG